MFPPEFFPSPPPFFFFFFLEPDSTSPSPLFFSSFRFVRAEGHLSAVKGLFFFPSRSPLTTPPPSFFSPSPYWTAGGRCRSLRFSSEEPFFFPFFPLIQGPMFSPFSLPPFPPPPPLLRGARTLVSLQLAPPLSFSFPPRINCRFLFFFPRGIFSHPFPLASNGLPPPFFFLSLFVSPSPFYLNLFRFSEYGNCSFLFRPLSFSPAAGIRGSTSPPPPHFSWPKSL